MRSPSVDIIVPVWNSPFETRNCLALIRRYSPGARLIVIDYGSNRETELMLEEFSEPLDDEALFIRTEKNIGIIKAINIGLASSDSDFAVIIKPHVQVTDNWLDTLIDGARFGISTPAFIGINAPKIKKTRSGVSQIETSSISLSALALKRELRETIGNFDEQLDGSVWCLADFLSRSAKHGFRTHICFGSKVMRGQETVFGSEARLAELAKNSCEIFIKRWGANKHFAIYFGRNVDTEVLKERMDIILRAARHGHGFTLFLHNNQNKIFLRSGWNGLHTSIEVQVLPTLFTKHRLNQRLKDICNTVPGVILVDGTYGALKQLTENAVSFDSISKIINEADHD